MAHKKLFRITVGLSGKANECLVCQIKRRDAEIKHSDCMLFVTCQSRFNKLEYFISSQHNQGTCVCDIGSRLNRQKSCLGPGYYSVMAERLYIGELHAVGYENW